MITQTKRQPISVSTFHVVKSHWIRFLLLIMIFSILAGMTSCNLSNRPSVTPVPTSTPTCEPATLTLGTALYWIQPIGRSADGSVAVPADTPDIAYWVNGTSTNYVFVLSPTEYNLALKTALKPGEHAAILWTDCTTVSLVITDIKTGLTNDATLFDQSTPGITLLVQDSSPTESVMIRGALQTSVTAVPSPSTLGVDAEITLVGTSTSTDGNTIIVSISILNTGKAEFSLSENDLSLTPEGAAPLSPVNVEPSLPRKIKPGASEVFQIVFSKPASKTAVLKVFNVEFDIEGF